jgi:hypothetical protein
MSAITIFEAVCTTAGDTMPQAPRGELPTNPRQSRLVDDFDARGWADRPAPGRDLNTLRAVG